MLEYGWRVSGQSLTSSNNEKVEYKRPIRSDMRSDAMMRVLSIAFHSEHREE